MTISRACVGQIHLYCCGHGRWSVSGEGECIGVDGVCCCRVLVLIVVGSKRSSLSLCVALLIFVCLSHYSAAICVVLDSIMFDCCWLGCVLLWLVETVPWSLSLLLMLFLLQRRLRSCAYILLVLSDSKFFFS